MTKVLTKKYRTTSLLMGGIALAAIMASQAQAQDNTTSVGEIVVTGSRIPTPNQASVSPITAVTSQDIALQGRTEISDVINNLPQNVINAVSDLGTSSNPLTGPGGITNADLRGLGPQRTLVLIDGRRLGIGDANTQNNNSAPDLNQIPSALVDHVEVVTGGASATYGSDAIAGVVNFVMKKDFEGVQLDVKGNFYQHSQDSNLVQGLLRAAGPGFSVPKDAVDGYGGDVDLIFGANAPDGKGNVTGYLEYHHQNPILQGERDFSSCQIKLHTGFVPFCTGSPNSNQFILQAPGSTGTGTTGGDGYTVIGNQFVPWDTAPATGNPPLSFNSQPVESLLHQDTRYLAGFMAHYDYSPHFNLYGSLNFMQDKTVTQVAQSGLFEGSGPQSGGTYLVNCNNPLLSAQQQALICSPADIASGATTNILIGRRAVENGGRSSEYDHVNYRAVIGAKGDITGPWTYDVYGSYYWTSLYQNNFNYLSNQHIQNALLVGGTAANPVCLSGTADGCVPYNIFTQGGVTPAQAAYVNSYGTSYGTISEIIGQANILGDLTTYGIKSPWATKGVSVALGVESRDQRYDYQPDQAELNNDLSGFGGAGTTIHKTLDVVEYYGEFRAPLIQDKPWVQDLTLDGGYRYSNYSTGVSPSTYKAGLEWSVNPDIRFRTSFQRAIRAPNIVELYNPQSVTNTSDVAVDPCAPTIAGGVLTPATATLAQCQHTGVTTAQYGNGGTTDTITQCPAGQCAVLNGGNPLLKPETADTWSIGFTVKPRFIPGFSGSIDYYNIKEQNLIGTIPLDTTLTGCLNTGQPIFCNNVVRASNGIIFGTAVAGGGYINGGAANVAAGQNNGIDFQATYDVDLNNWHLGDHGRLIFNFNGSENLKASTTPLPGAHSYDCAGLFGNTCQTVDPKWRHSLRISWQTPWDVLMSANWRYMSKVTWEGNTSDVTLHKAGGPDTFDHIPSYSYLDLSAQWNVRKGVTVTAGVNNVFDKNPPILNDTIVGTGLPNTYPTYDLLGREFFLGLSGKF